jgi:glycogen operon protein
LVSGATIKDKQIKDIEWFLPDGTEMQDEHWDHNYARSLAIFLNGEGIRSRGKKGEKIKDDSFYIMFILQIFLLIINYHRKIMAPTGNL